MIKKTLCLFVVLSVIALAGAASADFVRVKDVGTVPATEVNAYIVGYGNLSRVLTGAYQVQYENGPTVSGFCIDPRESDTVNFQTYEVVAITEPKFQTAAWVLDQYYRGLAAATPAQLAIWELVFDWRTEDFSAGNFQLLSSTSNYATLKLQATTIYDAAIDAFDSHEITPALLGKYMILSNGGYGAGYQDFMVPTPLPGALWLLTPGLIGLVGLKRRLRK